MSNGCMLTGQNCSPDSSSESISESVEFYDSQTGFYITAVMAETCQHLKKTETLARRKWRSHEVRAARVSWEGCIFLFKLARGEIIVSQLC